MLETENPQVIKLPVDGGGKNMNQQSNCWKSCDELADYHFIPSAWNIFMPTKVKQVTQSRVDVEIPN